ncbi:hypothetical protein TWF696_004178 [Orbilia brochopaga]|uniref:Uncharacterized protein n=1 Tax=Orbilia brochopaga TaxID=3140254 RepID=A0AAV9V7Z5_9PEZI
MADPSSSHDKATAPRAGTSIDHTNDGELTEEQWEHIYRTVPIITLHPPPPPTKEERHQEKIKSLEMLIEAIKSSEYEPPDALPEAYTVSMQKAKAAWEKGEVEWVDGRAYLWGPNGLVATGTIREMELVKVSFARKGIRDHHVDYVSNMPLHTGNSGE